ncbi:MAG: hypothetical protein CVV07_12165 [Gammaproteobacteria bacterium HGW-Gammaproteobacteria-11]|nr:MAG: hypothetical protein CVV07_12165 [Gammaproteobacteria bacterium HGW-Gammaproteobacteria-11]
MSQDAGRSEELPLEKRGVLVTAKSGMVVDTSDDIWTTIPNQGKGHRVNVAWLHSSVMPDSDRDLILSVFTYYLRNKAASTTSGIVINVKPFLMDGIPPLDTIKTIWSGIKTNHKKGLNQFFGTLSKQGNERFSKYHEFTRTHLDRAKYNALNPSCGALSEIEFDSLIKQINHKLQNFEWHNHRSLEFFQSHSGYGRLRNLVTNKVLLSVVRRPIQIALIKWSDLIPIGASFHDPAMRAVDEVGTLGGQTLQLRVHIAKAKRLQYSRECPELYPLHLSETISKILIDYKRIFIEGFGLLLNSNGLKLDRTEMLRLMNDMPMFPDIMLFSATVPSLEVLRGMFTPNSTAYHVSEAVITSAIRWVKVASDRSVNCIATSNRIRHTVLTRGAQDGLTAPHLAKITGVTVPAARHYVDLDYPARRQIDSHFIGNELMRHAFSRALKLLPADDEVIVDSNFNAVGGPHSKQTCATCSAVLGRPLGCYGCPNFRPILEADHKAVLSEAEDKLAVNRSSLVNPLHARSIEKLERQIAWVKLTIAICDEELAGQRRIDA